MADSDKQILITPNTSQSSEPKIEFTGADNNTVTLNALDDGTLSFEASSGQLFSVSDDLTGDIFSASDISGIPSITVKENGNVINNAYNGNMLVGTIVDNGLDKLQAYGNMSISGPQGEVFYVDEDLTGDVFSANDISGIPLLRVEASGNIHLAEHGGVTTLNHTHQGCYAYGISGMAAGNQALSLAFNFNGQLYTGYAIKVTAIWNHWNSTSTDFTLAHKETWIYGYNTSTNEAYYDLSTPTAGGSSIGAWSFDIDGNGPTGYPTRVLVNKSGGANSWNGTWFVRLESTVPLDPFDFN